MPSLHAETPIKSTVSKTVAVLSSIISAAVAVGFYAAFFLSDLAKQRDETNRRLSSIETFMRNEVVTQSQAERYAAAFKWENRDLRIVVPEPANFQDKPKS
jgi:hypothetical protein